MTGKEKTKYPKVHKILVRHFVLTTVFCLGVLGLGTYVLNFNRSIQSELYSSQLLLDIQAQHLDDEIEKLVSIADQMEQDSEIYALVREGITSQNYIAADYGFKKIVNRAYRGVEQNALFSVDLITPEYMLGDSIPGISFENAREFCLSYTDFEARSRPVITGSLSAAAVFGGDDPGIYGDKEFFAVIKRLNFVPFQAQGQEPPPPAILLILVDSALLRDTFEPLCESTQGAWRITDQTGALVLAQGLTPELPDPPPDFPEHTCGFLAGPYVGIRDRLPGAGWRVDLWLPTRPMNAAVMHASFMPLLWLLPVVAGLLAVYVFAMVRAVKRQVVIFNNALEQVKNGDFSSRIDPDQACYEETHLYALRFNEMTCKIQSLIQENYEGRLRSQEVEIMALNLQFNPHFLLNTLNVISWQLFHDTAQETDQTIQHLSRMILYTIRNQNSLVPLEEDIAWTKEYAAILKRRFGDKFIIFYDIPGELFRYLVPKLFLQIFIENAILHGFSEIDRQGLISIIGEEGKDHIRFYIRDNGCGLDESKYEMRRQNQNSHGLGIANITKRIELLFGSEGHIAIGNNEDCGVCVELRFPKRYI